MTKKFTTREIMSMLPEYGVENYEQISASRRYIYVEHEGKTWRFEAKTNTDGQDELQQEIDYFTRHSNDNSQPSSWEAVEVVKKRVTVTKYVPVEKP